MKQSQQTLMQQSLSRAVSCAGVGLHSGAPVFMALKPARADSGIVFLRNDFGPVPQRIIAHADFVTTTQLGTTIANAEGASVATIEHLMAALMAMGIDNVTIEIDGPEVPIMDGSSDEFVALIVQAGVKRLAAPRRRIEILSPIFVEDNGKKVELLPLASNMAAGLHLDVTVQFAAEAIGTQHCAIFADSIGFSQQLADARTFGFYDQIETMKAMGLGRGGSLDNAIVIRDGRVMNEDGLRHDNEFARHKALDAVGDLALAGGSIIGQYVGFCGGHALNVALVRALLANKSAWRWTLDVHEYQYLPAAGI